MIRTPRLIALMMLVMCAFAATPELATAQTPAPSTPAPSTPAPATNCDFTAIKRSLYGTESQGDYTATNSGGAAGRYQFMPGTRADYLRKHPECKADDGRSGSVACNTTALWIGRNCHRVQECIMDAYTAVSLARVRSDPACQQLLNGARTLTGTKNRRPTLSCNAGGTGGAGKLTESGLLAAMHLGGTGECRDLLANGHGDNDGPGGRGGTDTAWYACHHSNLPVPGNCAITGGPNTSGGNVAGPTGTLAQLNFTGIDLSGPEDPLRDWWDAALMLMAEQFTLNMEAQVEAIGMMFDAKHQLETQRLFQEKVAEAHKDYQPSEQMCTFGTFARDLVATERTTNLTRTAVAEHILEKEVGQGETMYADTSQGSLSRIAQFRKKFCDPSDNINGLRELCPQGGPLELRNRDINFTQTLDQPLSLDIDFNDATVTQDEETVFALVDNLFATDPLPRAPEEAGDLRKFNYNYLNLRSITAMRGIARNSIANIIAMKTATPNKGDETNAPYLRALMREFGLPDEEIFKILGENPSYNAQMEFLTRKMYQNPQFYTNLYDKPANIKRIRAAMKAIKLMQDRDIQAALQRREMLMSIMLELKLREEGDAVYNATENSLFNSSITSPTGGPP